MSRCCSPWFWRNTVFLASAVGLVAYFACKSDVISKNVKPEFAPKIAELPKKDLEVKRGEMREGFAIDTLIQVNADKIAKGKELYAANCLGCHGADAKGNAALGSRNLTTPKSSDWLNSSSFAGLFATLTDGVGKMPAFATLSVPERTALIHYIESLGDYEKPSASDSKILDEKFGLSKAAKTPNQVPVERAMEMMVKEKTSTP